MAGSAPTTDLSRRGFVASALAVGAVGAAGAVRAAPAPVDLDAYLGLLAAEFRAAMAERYPDHPLARLPVWTAPGPAPLLAGDAPARRRRVVAALT